MQQKGLHLVRLPACLHKMLERSTPTHHVYQPTCIRSLLLMHLLYYSLSLASAAAAPSYLDTAGLSIITASGLGHAVKVDPRGCERAPGSCNPLNDYWGKVAAVWPGRVWRLSCEDQPAICEGLGSPVAHDPFFLLWTGETFERYRGEPSPLAMLRAAQQVLGPELLCEVGRGPDEMCAAVESGTDALGAAEASSIEYLGRRDTLLKAAAMVEHGDHRGGAELLGVYLQQWPEHPNALLAAANAARVGGDGAAALAFSRRVLALEPLNARLHAGVASSLAMLGKWRDAAAALERGLAAPAGTHDAEEDVEPLRRALQHCRERVAAAEQGGAVL